MKKILLIFLLIFIPTVFVNAQTTIVFNVDLSAVMNDSTFIPGEDEIQIKGDLYPLTPSMPVKMQDEAPIDSIYTVELRFPSQYDGKKLNFNFEIAKKRRIIKEQVTRTLFLNGEKIELQTLGFDYSIR